MRRLTTRWVGGVGGRGGGETTPGLICFFGIVCQALHDTFAAFGNVLSCKVAVDENGRSRGYGFVHYETAEAADAAIKAVNGMLLNDKKVYVGHHVSKKERMSKVEEMKAHFTNIYVKNVDEGEFWESVRRRAECGTGLTDCFAHIFVNFW